MMTRGETRQLQLLQRYLVMSLLVIGLVWFGVSSEDSGDVVLSPATAQAAAILASRDSTAAEEDSESDGRIYPDPYYMHREPHDDGGYFYYGTTCYSSGRVEQIACI